jgi:hypothetical protein
MRTWKDNAREFEALSKQGYGVRLALLAACSVAPADGCLSRDGEKVTIRQFAEAAGVSKDTVARYVIAWDKMVVAGWDVDRAALTPAMSDVLKLPPGFVEEFDALPKGGHVAKADELGISPGAAAIVNSSATALAAAIKADPETARVASETVLDRPEALVAAASDRQLNQVSEAMLQRTLRDAGMPPAGPRSTPGDPRPEWAKQVTRIGLDAHEVTQMVSRLRDEGRGDLADWCYRERRKG